jgi:arylsulfatase A-like enzyme
MRTKVILLLACFFILTTAFFLGTKESDKFKIYWNEKLIKGKTDYLAEKPEDVSSHERPNVIIILADDLGQTDISLYGGTKVSTPNIDAIGKNGATFSEGYISSPVCSPSRAGLLTGRYQQRFGHEIQPSNRYLKSMIEYYGFKLLPRFRPLSPIKSKEVPEAEERLRQGLPPSEITIADVLKKYDYNTGIIGKWHLGAADFAKPCARGFDYQYGFYEAFTLYAPKSDTSVTDMPVKGDFMDKHQWKEAEGRTGNCAILRNCCERQEENKYLTDKLTDEAIAYIDRSKEKPFFLYLPYNAPHAPLQAQNKYYNQFKNIKDPVKRVYASMIKNLDDEVGRLMNYLKVNGLEENTIIFFLSDNGGAVYNGTTDNFPYRGGKLTNFEGGIRVPFMMQWKGKIQPGAMVSTPVISLDIFKTVANAVGITLPTDRDYDGIDLFQLANKTSVPDRALCWRSEFNKGIRKGEWKMLMNEFDKTNVLYNLKTDVRETKNVYAEHPEVVEALQKEFNAWEKNMIQPLWPRVVNYIYKDSLGMNTFAF